jgi:isoleucyl-tRNA synthetase
MFLNQKPGEITMFLNTKGNCEVAKRFMEAIVFTTTPWAIISNEKCSMVVKAWKLAIEAQDSQRELAGAAIGTPSVCQLPGGASLKTVP